MEEYSTTTISIKSDGDKGLINNCEIILIDKMISRILLEGNFFRCGCLKPWPHMVLILMKVTIINFYPQLISILACDMLQLNDNHLLMLMLNVSLSLMYHVISVTYVQFLTITSIFCMFV